MSEQRTEGMSFAETLNARIAASGLDVASGAFTATIAQTIPVGRASIDSMPTLPLVQRPKRPEEPAPSSVSIATHQAPSADLEIVELIGEGGMGVVHLARQHSLDREVALKTVRAGVSPEGAIALLEEARVTGRLEHPNIVPVHAVGVGPDGQPVMVMKRIDGVSWQTLLEDEGHEVLASLGPGDRLDRHLRILIAVARALEFAHRRGVVHRDVKPDNVMVGRFGEVYLVDWGLAVDSGTPTGPRVVGTPVYMAPEMVDGGVVDARTDVYLLGGALHHLLTGAPTHRGESLHALLLKAYLSEPPVFGDEVPPELAAVARRALARAPADRFADAGEMRAELSAFQVYRAALELTTRSERQMETLMAEMAELGAASDPAAPRPVELESRRAALRRRVMECRFGFHMAIEQWRDNARALRGLRRCAGAEVELSLIEGNPHAARHALAALDEPSPELEARVCSAEAALRSAETARHQARQLLRDLDERVSVGARRRLAMLLGAMQIVMGIAATAASAYGTFDVGDALAVVLVVDVAVAVAAVLRRRDLLANVYNMRLGGLLAVTLMTITLNRWVGWLYDEALATVLIRDAVVMAAIAAAGAVSFVGWLGWMVPVLLGAAAFAAVSPRWAAQGFVGALLLTLFIVIRRWKPTPSSEDPTE